MRQVLSIIFFLGLSFTNSYSEVISELSDKVLEEVIYVDPETTGGTEITMYGLCGSGIQAWCAWYLSDKKTFMTPPSGKTYPCQTGLVNNSAVATEGITKYTISVPEHFQDGISYYVSWSKYGASSPCEKISFWKHFVIKHAVAFQYKEAKNVHRMTAPINSKVRIAPNDVRIENYFVKSDENSTQLIQADKFVFVKKHKAGTDESVDANYGEKDNIDYAALMAYEYDAPSLPSSDTIECWAYKGSTALCKVETFYMEYRNDVGPSLTPIIDPNTLRTLYKESFENYETTADFSPTGLGRDTYSGNWISLSGLYDGSNKGTDECKSAHTCPSRGEYAIMRNGAQVYSTPMPSQDGNYFLFVDAGNTITKYYETVISNMCAGVSLQFSAWLVSKAIGTGGSLPNLKFVIRNADTDEEIASYVTGNISSGNYQQYGFEMKVPDNTPNLKFEICNNTLATTGNDVSIDNIGISLVERELGTIINYSQDQIVSACSDLNLISFSGTLEDSPYNRTYYKWQICPGDTEEDTKWQDFTDLSERPQYDIPPSINLENPSFNEDGTPHVVTGYYRLMAGDYRSVSENVMQCVQVSKSNKVTLQNVVVDLESEYAKQNICNEGHNGSVKIVVSGGDFPYTFSFSGRQDTVITATSPCVQDSKVHFVFDKLDAGIYELNVSDVNHCVASEDYQITQDKDVKHELTVEAKPSFGTANGSFSISGVTKGNVLIPYSYEIRRNGVVLSSGVSNVAGEKSTISNLKAGAYEVEVWSITYSDRGCSSVTTFLLPEELDYQVVIKTSVSSASEGNSASVTLQLQKTIDKSEYVNQIGKDILVGVSLADISTTKVVDYKNGNGLKYVLADSVVDNCTIPQNSYYAVIPNGASEVTFYVDYLTDNVMEQDEKFMLMMTSVLNAETIETYTKTESQNGVKVGVGDPYSQRMIIQDVSPDDLYVVLEPVTGYGYEAKTMTKKEDGSWESAPPVENGWFEVSLRDAAYNKILTGQALDVYYHVDPASTATLNLDYRQLSSIVSIPNGMSSGRAYIHVLEDNLIEGDETVIIRLDSVRTKTISSEKLGIMVGKDKTTMLAAPVSNLPEEYSDEAIITILDDEVVTVRLPIEISIRPQSVKVYESDNYMTRKAGLYLTILNQTHLLDRDILVTINMDGTAVCGMPTDAADAGDFYYEYVDPSDMTKNISYSNDARDKKEKDKRFNAIFPEGSSDSPLFYIYVNNDNWLEYHETEYLYLNPTIGDEDKMVHYTDYFTDPTTFKMDSVDITVRVLDSTVVQIIDDERDWLSLFSSATACSGTAVSHDKSLIKSMLKTKIANIDNYDISYVYYPRNENADVDYSAQFCYEGCDGLYQQLTIPVGEADVPFDGVVTFTGIPYSAADHTNVDDDDDDCISVIGMRKLEQINTEFNMTIHVIALPRLQFGDNKLK